MYGQGSPRKSGCDRPAFDVVSRQRISALFAALAVVGMGRTAWFHFVSEPRHEPRRERIDTRYAPIKEFVGPGQAGYLSDVPPTRGPISESGTPGNRLYLQAQYALAPLVLRPGEDRLSQVVINVADPARVGELLRTHRLTLVVEPTPGVAVARPR